MMKIKKEINPRFEDFLFDWDYAKYLLVGGYGSSKSYHIAFKIILKCMSEKRKVLVVREVYDTHRDSTFSLFTEILESLGLLVGSGKVKKTQGVQVNSSPFRIHFPNGSEVVFKGMDKPAKLKSINGVSIIWIEEASEVKYVGYKELLGRLRHPTLSLHIFLSLNPVGKDNWTYSHFFKHLDDEGKEIVTLDDERLYEKHTLVKNGVYYHHSLPEDNKFLPPSYLKELESLKEYDPDLYRVAREGKFGVNGTRVLPQFEIVEDLNTFNNMMSGANIFYNGMDFGFEDSYNAVVRVAIDDKEKILYIYEEYYKNHMTDDKTAKELMALGYDDIAITADSAEPKAISFFQQSGFLMRKCHKSAGSRLANTRKVKRFKKIYCSPECPNTIRELRNLTYKTDNKGNLIYDEFNIDPHTFSAIWYALDVYDVADVKRITRNSKSGG